MHNETDFTAYTWIASLYVLILFVMKHCVADGFFFFGFLQKSFSSSTSKELFVSIFFFSHLTMIKVAVVLWPAALIAIHKKKWCFVRDLIDSIIFDDDTSNRVYFSCVLNYCEKKKSSKTFQTRHFIAKNLFC